MKLLIVGGAAGGAAVAARARRLDEHAEIILFERGEHVSFANCGLPYHAGEVIATAVKHRMTVLDLAELELAYALPFGSSRDAINLVGMAAVNHRDGMSPLTHWDTLTGNEQLLDVRTIKEIRFRSVPDALHVPVDILRSKMEQLDKDRPVAVFCQVGIRAHIANRILLQNGFDSQNVSGGYLLWSHRRAADME